MTYRLKEHFVVEDGDVALVHLFKNNGYFLALDVNSGSLHSLDEITYNVIGKMNEGFSADECRAFFPDADIEEVLGEIDELKAEGMLFSDASYEEAFELHSGHKTVVKALCLHVAHACNLSCRYCFAGEGEYHGERALMSLENAKRALEFLVENSGTRRNLEVDFFGGEPLLNWDVVKETVKYGRELEKKHDKRFRFTITTNGVLLNGEVEEFCRREMSNVVLSIDGRKGVNDRMRPFRNGEGSYDRILPLLLHFEKSREGKDRYVRGTFTHFNLDFSEDVKHLADLGFKNISVEPVVAPATEDYAIRKEDIPVILEQYDILAQEYLKRKKEGRPFTFFHFMIDLNGGPCVYKRLTGCGAGTEYLAVTPEGKLYPCHQFVGNTDFCVGDIHTGITRPDITGKFSKCNVFSRDECRECFARYYCSGGCAANAYNFTNDINGTYEIGCECQRKRIECALMIKAAEAESNTEGE